MGRITALGDVFDALISERPYKAAWPMEQAVDEIKQKSGTHFDPELVHIFCRLLDQFRFIKDNFK